MKKIVIIYALFIANIFGDSGNALRIKNLDEQLINEKCEHVARIIRFKKITSIGLGISAVCVGAVLLKMFYKDLRATSNPDSLTSASPVTAFAQVNAPGADASAVPVDQVAQAVGKRFTAIADIPAKIVARTVAFIKDFPSKAQSAAESTARATKSVFIQYYMKIALAPILTFFTEKVHGEVNAHWVLSKSRFSLNLQNIRHAAYKINPDETVTFKDKQNIDTVGVSAEPDSAYVDLFVVNVNSLVESISLFLGLLKHGIQAGEQDASAQVIYDHVIKITNVYVDEINSKLAAEDNNQLLKTTIRFLNILRQDIDSFIVMET